ncbi:MMPL family transporter [Methylotuvimicrobium sp. KM2]|uniref:efflux RND transporter permease subunit n=1 Tax=Methylotuvimicrobium sp. KM2 TaxID=3133976 RepID=UPI003101262F
MHNDTSVSRSMLFIVERPWITVVFCFVIVLISALGMPRLTFDNDYRSLFSEDNPQLLAFDKIQSTYNKSDNVLFVIAPSGNDVFTPEVLSAIALLTEKAWQLPFSSRVDSITNFQHTSISDGELVVADLVLDPSDISSSDLGEIKKIALNEPLLVNRLVSRQGHVAGVNVTVQLPELDPMEVTEVAAAARGMAEEIKTLYPKLEIHLTGMVMMNNAFVESTLADSQKMTPIMYGMIILVLLLSLRSFSATFGSILLIIFTLLAVMGFFGWLRWPITPVSVTAPTIIMTMAVADCVHLLVAMLQNMRQGQAKKEALLNSLKINFKPMLLTSVTTAIGFLSMNFSDAPPFRDLGNIVACGVLVAFLLTMTILPAIMMILPVRVKLCDASKQNWMDKLALWVIRRPKFLLVVNGGLVLILTAMVTLNELNDEFVKYFDETVEFRRATDFLDQEMGGFYTIEIALSVSEEGGLNEPLVLEKVEQLSQWLQQQPEVLHVNSITDTFKRLNQNMHDGSQDEYKLPAARDLAAQYLLMYEMSLPYGLDLNDQVNIDKSGTRMIATLKSLSSNEMLVVESRLHNWLKTNMPDIDAEVASPVLMFSHIGKRNIASMMGGTLLALVLISFILVGAFRSFKLGLLSLVPNLAPAGVAFGVWALIDGNVGLGLSIVTGMTLGIVVDDTVHFISKYRRARVEREAACDDAVRYAFSTVGSAMWVTSVVLISGFAVLSFSHFTVNSDMGLLTAITIGIALFMDLFLLPPILMCLDRK